MTGKLDDFEELASAARHGKLSKNEAQRLERAFEDSPDERIWHQAGLRFDAEDAQASRGSQAADELLERVLAGRPRLRVEPLPLSRSRRVRPVVLLVAAAALVASAAAAVVGIVRLGQAPPDPAPAAPHVEPPSAAPRKALTTAAPTLATEPQPAPSAAAPSPESVAATPRPRDLSEAVPQTAAELLSSAGRARRKGETGRAISLLESLQSRFPGSPEAKESDISLGMLRLQSGSGSSALRDFDRYLARSPGGARTPDALWGRAKALLALGRRSEADESLRKLLARYPQSPFTSAAQAELRQGSPASP
jgi:TolA-binding protein